jgi:hypothetical protein
VPFCEVTWAFAQAEGEGFVDLDDWRAAHRRYWARESGVDVSDDELVVCLWFEVIADAEAHREGLFKIRVDPEQLGDMDTFT